VNYEQRFESIFIPETLSIVTIPSLLY